MKIAGRIDAGATVFERAIDTKRVSRFHMPAPGGNVAKGSVYLDGQGSGVGAQVCRMVIYDTTDMLLATSGEVTVQDGQAPGWVDFAFPSLRGKLLLPTGDFYAGLHCGANTNTIRTYGSDPHGMGGKQNTDSYSDGASASFGAATALTSDVSLYITYFTPFVNIYPTESDLYFGRLPFTDAQVIFAMGSPERLTQRVVDVGWHDTFIDPETGSFALVSDGSGLEDYVGERILVTAAGTIGGKSVYAYVHDLIDADLLPWDISLTRHLYAMLAPLSTDTVSTIVEVIG